MTPKHAGYATIVQPGRSTKCFDTQTCSHCNRVVCWATNSPDANPDLGGFCRLCMAFICTPCVGKDCVPFKKKLELYESRQALFRQMGLEL